MVSDFKVPGQVYREKKMALTEPRELRRPPHHITSHGSGCPNINPEESSHLFDDMKTRSLKGINYKLQEVGDNIGHYDSLSTSLIGGAL